MHCAVRAKTFCSVREVIDVMAYCATKTAKRWQPWQAFVFKGALRCGHVPPQVRQLQALLPGMDMALRRTKPADLVRAAARLEQVGCSLLQVYQAV